MSVPREKPLRADGNLVAYHAATGKELWRFNVGLGISAPPITYAVNGRQYVALLVGWGGSAAAIGGALLASHGWAYGVHQRRLVAFSLEGKATLPPSPAPAVVTPIGAKDFPVDVAAAARGAGVFLGRCAAATAWAQSRRAWHRTSGLRTWCSREARSPRYCARAAAGRRACLRSPSSPTSGWTT